jgi:hypothetical protein
MVTFVLFYGLVGKKAGETMAEVLSAFGLTSRSVVNIRMVQYTKNQGQFQGLKWNGPSFWLFFQGVSKLKTADYEIFLSGKKRGLRPIGNH